MPCSSIKFHVHQNPTTKEVEIQTYRPLTEKNGVIEWMMVDRSAEMNAAELKYLADFIYSLFKKAKSK